MTLKLQSKLRHRIMKIMIDYEKYKNVVAVGLTLIMSLMN